MISNITISCQQELKASQWVDYLCLTADQQTLFCGIRSGIEIYKLDEKGKFYKKQTLTAHSRFISSLKYDNINKNLISGSFDKKIIIWRKNQDGYYALHQELNGHINCLRALCLHSESRLLISGSKEKLIFWRLGSDNKYSRFNDFGHSIAIYALTYDHDTKRLFIGRSDGLIMISDLDNNGNNQQIPKILKSQNKSISSLFYSSRTKTLFSGSEDNTIIVWKEEEGNGLKQLQVLKGHNKGVHCLNFIENSKTLISCSDDKTIKAWFKDDIGRFSKKKTLVNDTQTGKVKQFIYIENQSLVIWGSSDKTVKFLDVSKFMRNRNLVNIPQNAFLRNKEPAMDLLNSPSQLNSDSDTNANIRAIQANLNMSFLQNFNFRKIKEISYQDNYWLSMTFTAPQITLYRRLMKPLTARLRLSKTLFRRKSEKPRSR